MSDGFDDLFGVASLFNPADPLTSSFINVLDSPNDHLLGGFNQQNFDFHKQNTVQKNCSSCGHHCILYGLKWRFVIVMIYKSV